MPATQSRPRVLSPEEIRQRQLQASSSSPSPSTPRSGPQPIRNQANVDIRKTKAYKAASRKWISTIVALPILFYTSYELYERTYGTKVQKKLVTVSRESEDRGIPTSSNKAE